ncbi:MAG: hypothetical protein CVU05_07785 [Bacteroidetes bacterium HGW-Bacteroidetes-21]|jgi:hypothetical protein|nr:MAG: hypothetical protein CVU05_07785 [Bacteroidetes bacterium HGW-Bacteroidetes-21]
MKRFIKSILVFLLLLPLVYILGVIVWGEVFPQFLKKNLSYKVIGGYTQSRLHDVKNFKNVDVLVIGPSGAYRGFDPRNFDARNIKLFNLGSSSQTPIQTELLVDKYIDQLNPKLVLYVVNPDIFCDPGIESMVDLISCNFVDRHHVTVPLKTYNINVYNTLIYSTYKSLIGGDGYRDEVITRDKEEKYISGGFVEKGNNEFAETTIFPPIPVSIQSDQTQAFKNILMELNKRKIKVIIIQPPLVREYYSSFKMKEIMNRFFKKLGFRYMNFNAGLPFEHKYFYDYGHLNQSGVDLFNKMVIDSLEEEEGLVFR